ncbi:hypothetical protein ACO0LC_02910 [Undibacterium sp. JH2W]|uniref:hypothetical protein n=1 Tax=Undibacterium sp. JH2W TaxID=3413037 RepID=UPI003BF43F71
MLAIALAAADATTLSAVEDACAVSTCFFPQAHSAAEIAIKHNNLVALLALKMIMAFNLLIYKGSDSKSSMILLPEKCLFSPPVKAMDMLASLVMPPPYQLTKAGVLINSRLMLGVIP